MAPRCSTRTIIFDLGDVLFNWSPATTTNIPPKMLKRIFNSSPVWFEYERGHISESECYQTIGAEYSIDPDQLRDALVQARASLTANGDMVALIHRLRSQYSDTLQIVAMSNISAPDYETVMQTRGDDLSLFDQVFPSCEAGERKPHLGFYRQVLQKTKSDPRSTVMVDDKSENILTARSLGVTGIVFDNCDQVRRHLFNFLGDPVQRGLDYLRENAGNLPSVTSTGEEVRENFCQLLLLETTKDMSLVDVVDHPRTWQFFAGSDKWHTDDFPNDLDTTSIGLSVLPRDNDVVSSVLDEMLTYADNDGIIQTYFDKSRPRLDPVVCVNVLTLFYIQGRGADVKPTFEWVYNVLLNRAYLDGTRYYYGPEPFLYFLSRLILSAPTSSDVQNILKPVFTERVRERIGHPGHAQELAMRILACESVGICDSVDLTALLDLQCEDGSWEVGWLYKFVTFKLEVGNRGLTTALAICAVEAVERLSTRETRILQPTPTSIHRLKPILITPDFDGTNRQLLSPPPSPPLSSEEGSGRLGRRRSWYQATTRSPWLQKVWHSLSARRSRHDIRSS